jgi:hypothetical protein
MNIPEIVARKRKLARTLLAQARQWEKPSYLAFVGPARRRVKVISLRAQAKRQLEGIRKMETEAPGENGALMRMPTAR